MLSIKMTLILLVATLVGCNVRSSQQANSASEGLSNSHQAQATDKLSKSIVIFIGRGGCCYGHAISIDKRGELEYVVASYSGSESDVLGTFYPGLLVVDEKYSRKKKKLSDELLVRVERLIGNEEDLIFRDWELVDDDHLFHVYLDNKGIGYGYQSNLQTFPANLRELITLVTGQIELHELPGMA